MQAKCFGSLEPSSGLYQGLMMAQASRNM